MVHKKLTGSEMGRISPQEYKTARPESGLVVVLDNVRSAHNVGSAFRSSDAFGVDAICLCGICSVPPGAEIHKTALGAEESVPFRYYPTTREALEDLRAEDYSIISVEQAHQSVSLSDFRREKGRKYALVFGNEVDGVSQETVDESDIVLEIPQFGTKHSLNVSVSVGVVLWEIVKQGL